ncbi:MAG: SAM-dependent methyltransferase, partial [Bacteroidota bacterium]
MSNIRIITTGDDSHSLYLPELNEHYHSTHGAVQESQHVYIDAGLKQTVKNEVSILEIGFGTGLNALLSLVYAVNHNISIVYTSIEKYPLPEDVFKNLNYGSYLEQGNFQ